MHIVHIKHIILHILHNILHIVLHILHIGMKYIFCILGILIDILTAYYFTYYDAYCSNCIFCILITYYAYLFTYCLAY